MANEKLIRARCAANLDRLKAQRIQAAKLADATARASADAAYASEEERKAAWTAAAAAIYVEIGVEADLQAEIARQRKTTES